MLAPTKWGLRSNASLSGVNNSGRLFFFKDIFLTCSSPPPALSLCHPVSGFPSPSWWYIDISWQWVWGLLLPQSYAPWCLVISHGSCVFLLIRLPLPPTQPARLFLPLLSRASWKTLLLIRIELSAQNPSDSLYFTSDPLVFTICFSHSSLIVSLHN